MRILPYVLLAAAPMAIVACVSQDDSEDLGGIADGKSDAPAIQNKAITVNKRSSATKPGVKNYTVRSTVDFTVSLVQTESGNSLITVTNADTDAAVSSEKTKNPIVAVTAPDGEEHEYKIRIENWDAATLHATLSATGNQAVSPALLAAA
ncbi:MAG TPA: hypothetical protein VGM90_37495, partial [Kofleriaceae bacterium]